MSFVRGLFGPPDVEKLKAKKDVQGLIKALAYKKDAQVRRAAAGALGRLREECALQALVAALGDPEPAVRQSAVWAIAALGESALGPLVEVLRSRTTDDREAAARALAGMGEPGMHALVSVLARSPGARSCAVAALASIGAPAIGPLVQALGGYGGYGVEGAVEALVQIGAPAIEPLLSLRDTRVRVRLAAAQVLEKLGWQPDRSESGAWYHIRREAWDECVKIGAPAVEPLIAALPVWRSEVVATTLAEIGDARAVLPLLEWMDSLVPSTREVVGQVWERMGARAVEPLIARLTDERWLVQVAAVQALGRTGDARAVEPLIARLTDERWQVQAAAVQALGQTGAARAVEALIAREEALASALESADWVPEALLEELERTGGARTVAALIGRLCGPVPQTSLEQEQWHRIGRALYSVCRRLYDSPSWSQVEEQLVAVLVRGESLSVCEKVATALDEMGWRPGRDTAGAAYWAAKGRWDECVSVGAAAVEPLITALARQRGFARRGAAKALAALYHGGGLDERARQAILAQSAILSHPHMDGCVCNDHHDSWSGAPF